MLVAPLLIILGLLFIIPPVYAQQNGSINEIDTPAEVRETTLPIDAATIGTVVATAGGLLVKDRKDKKDLEKQLDMKEVEIARLNKEKQESDEQQDAILTSIYKIFTAASLYPDKNLKEILDLKATNNPLEKFVLGEELATNVNKKVRWTNQVYNVPMPNMSVPSAQVINATTVVSANKVVEGQTK
jgi:chaperonin cofactor prefoldin